jgi:hypothetical protein
MHKSPPRISGIGTEQRSIEFPQKERYLPSTISKNKYLLVAVGHSMAAIPLSVKSAHSALRRSWSLPIVATMLESGRSGDE